TGNRVLEAGRVRRVTSDGYIHTLFPHNSHTFANIVCTIAFYFGTRTVAVCNFTNYFQFTCVVVELSLNVCKAVDTGDNLCSVLAETVQDATQRLFTYFVCFSGNFDSTFGSSE